MASGWINVTDRLPELNQQVWIRAWKGVVLTRFTSRDFGGTFNDISRQRLAWTVHHSGVMSGVLYWHPWQDYPPKWVEPCCIPGCSKAVYVKHMCANHYQQDYQKRRKERMKGATNDQ